MEIHEQREYAVSALKRLHILDPRAIIAGGAPRDWYIRKKARDVDLYLHLNPAQFGEGEIKRSLEFVLGVDIERAGEQQEEEYQSINGLRAVFNVEGEDDTPLQIMVMNEPTFSTLDHFLFSNSKYWMQADGNIRYDNDARLSHVLNIIFYKPVLTAQSQRYFNKIRGYYPESTFEPYENIDNHLAEYYRRVYG